MISTTIAHREPSAAPPTASGTEGAGHRSRAILAIVAAGLLAGVLAAQSTLDVPAAYGTIQAAIAAASPGDSVVVAPGTYVENIDFLGKAITVLASAGPQSTTIDGGGSGTVVEFVNGETTGSVLHGFTITNGVGTDSAFFGLLGYAGGIMCDGSSPTIRNCIITGNSGRAAHEGGGGGIGCYQASPTISGCVIHGNAGGAGNVRGGGGGVYVWGGTAAIVNATISANVGGQGGSTHGGGGVYTSDQGGSSVANIVNSIVWDNFAFGGLSQSELQVGGGSSISATYSDIRGGYPGTGNIDADPLLDATFHLGAGSPCFDSGDPGASSNLLVDIDGDPRVIGCNIDIGADESPTIVIVSAGESIQSAINAACDDHIIEVGPGTYVENINFQSKDITVRSAAGPAATIIDGGGSATVVALPSSPRAKLEGFTIRNGSSAIFGAAGGIYCEGRAAISNCIITGNSSSFGAGGIACRPGFFGINEVSITNCLIHENTGGNFLAAGGIFVDSGVTATIVNATIMSNIDGSMFSPVPAGISALGTVSLVNSIVWGNQSSGTTSTNGPPISPSFSASYCDIDYTGIYPGIGNINQDPLAGPELDLGCASPCIDSGNSSAVGIPSLDLFGNPRIFGAAVDMGAIESEGRPYPGTSEDFLITTTVNGQTNPHDCTEDVAGGDLLVVGIESPGGTFDGFEILLLAQLFATGSPPTGPAPFTGALHVDPAGGVVIIYGPSPIFGPALLPAGGFQVPFFMPSFFPSGTSVILQALSLTFGPPAANGFFAISDGHELKF